MGGSAARLRSEVTLESVPRTELPDTDTLELPARARPDAGRALTDTRELGGRAGSPTDEIPAEVREDPAVRPLLVLTATLEERYSDLAFHGRSVAGYCALAGRELGLPPATVERVALAGELHDVGKVGIASEILRKPEPLDDTEWDQIRRHPQIGADLLYSSNLDDVARWVLAHHERPDSSGYPYGADGEAIPIEARILAVGDAYDAMRTDRVYKAALTHAEAAAELRAGAGTQFDREVVDAFLSALERLGSRRAA